MSAIEGFCYVRSEPTDLNQEAVDLAGTIQGDFEGLGI